ncbi:hypothetical protein D9757_013381 [Collybiopsis confluens]|uniref:Uncharacterized protein n=1 Tax=Collybiopsis confluens TaxID=2823264 RepID=A0A8H5CQV4_9AGAR|nr:hypothetical protein D9757_013381 [Collybiopsis confluens]
MVSSMNQLVYELFHKPSSTSTKKETWVQDDRDAFSSRKATTFSFLCGKSTRSVADILDIWMRYPYGSTDTDSPQMYSLTAQCSYTAIKAVRPALTSFAVQVVQRRLKSQMREAVKHTSGLYRLSKFHPPRWKLASSEKISVCRDSISSQRYTKIPVSALGHTP